VNETLSIFVAVLLKAGVGLLVANEIRGLVLAGPVLYAMYAAGGTLMAIWIAVCSLAGIALSIIGPLFVGKRLKLI
jgi:hypothetical protein